MVNCVTLSIRDGYRSFCPIQLTMWDIKETHYCFIFGNSKWNFNEDGNALIVEDYKAMVHIKKSGGKLNMMIYIPTAKYVNTLWEDNFLLLSIANLIAAFHIVGTTINFFFLMLVELNNKLKMKSWNESMFWILVDIKIFTLKYIYIMQFDFLLSRKSFKLITIAMSWSTLHYTSVSKWLRLARIHIGCVVNQ